MPAFRHRLLALVLVALSAGAASAQTSDLVAKDAFRVCADPAALPMSNDKGEGYENQLADLFASKLGVPVEYTFFPMVMGFVRNTLRANKCDVIMGYAQGDDLVSNTNHYMTSSYVLVTKAKGPLAQVTTFEDPALKAARIGVVAGTPPADHMARNGLLKAARAYRFMVDRRYESPVQDMLRDLEADEIDAAIAWGPLAGPLIKKGYPDMTVTPLIHEPLPPRLFFRITMAVRIGDAVWQRKLNSLIRRNQGEIDAILSGAGVPLLNDMGTASKETAK